MIRVMQAEKDDTLTIAAIAVLAMSVVTFDHEALGHGSVCLALGGHITTLTSSIFRCDTPSGLIDPAGPVMNLLIGTVALIASRFVPHHRPGLRLFLILVASLSYFWESGYAAQAMWHRHGDLYFAGLSFLGEPSLWWRIAGATVGIGIFLFTVRLTSRSLLGLWSKPARARSNARTVWFAATTASLLAALAYQGGNSQNLHDAFMEIGVAACPLLLIPMRKTTDNDENHTIERSPTAISLAILVFAAFTLTLGRGIST